MAALGYTQTRYYDSSTTASCGGSPIIIQTTGTGCSSAIAGNTNGLTCATYGGSTAAEYTMYSGKCSTEPFDFAGFTRNYVVKRSFATSDKCEGNTLEGIALAADGLCHQTPSTGGNGTRYVRANCNGGQPILDDCSDSKCTQCTTSTYSKDPCQLTGAGASLRVECVNAAVVSGGNGISGGNGNRNATLPDFNRVGNGAINSISSKVKIAMAIVVVCAQIMR